ncbi:MAG: type III-A CRISPR-associated RAMP protein Csm5 [Thermocrinis sp.]|jgi:CRISPR-associated protein Csm5|uniref:type III-A CRISPR-associated RAMP protein Csm5 n=1 Tax=Thermocrinis sp. TaxID=2024383 RepID=UPI003C0CA24D
MRVRVKVLSPVHIGNGERISRLEFFVEKGRLKVYKFDRIISTIERLANPQLRNNAYLWFKTSKNLSLEEFLRNFKINLEPNYELEINGSLNSSQVEEFIKILEGPYIPGSELKGSIRHLIACAWFMDKPDLVIEKVKQLLNSGRAKDQREQNNVEGELERSVFYPKGERDAQFDVLKVLSIPDSQPLPYQSLRVEVPKLIGSNRTLYPCEALKEGVEFEMEININKNAYRGLETQRKLPEIGKHFSDENAFWNFLVDCSRNFYSKLLDEEIKFFQNRHQDIAKHLEKLKNHLNTSGVLLRLGKHEGILSTTLLLIVKEKDKALFDEFFRATQNIAREQTNKTRRVNSQGLTFGWLLLERL